MADKAKVMVTFECPECGWEEVRTLPAPKSKSDSKAGPCSSCGADLEFPLVLVNFKTSTVPEGA